MAKFCEGDFYCVMYMKKGRKIIEKFPIRDIFKCKEIKGGNNNRDYCF